MDPFVAALLSFLLVGLGQMCLGQVAKGIVMLVGAIVLGTLTLGVAVFVTIPISVIDAYLIAKKLREGRTVGDWEFF